MTSQKLPLIDLLQAEEEIQVVVQLLITELLLYGLSSGRDLRNIFDKMQSEENGIGHLLQIEVFLYQASQDQNIVVLQVCHSGEAPPSTKNLPCHLSNHDDYPPHPALAVSNPVVIFEIDVLEMGQTPHVIIEEPVGVGEMELKIIEHFGVAGQPITYKNVCVLLLGVLLSASHQPGIHLEDVTLRQFVHLRTKLVENGLDPLHQCLTLHGEATR